MKISVIICEGQKQIMMTPQTDHERRSLKFIHPTDTLQVVSRVGSFDDEYQHVKEQVSMCQGGYLRRFPEADSLMFLIEDCNEHQ